MGEAAEDPWEDVQTGRICYDRPCWSAQPPHEPSGEVGGGGSGGIGEHPQTCLGEAAVEEDPAAELDDLETFTLLLSSAAGRRSGVSACERRWKRCVMVVCVVMCVIGGQVCVCVCVL